jgi:hypothetical protein
VTQRWIEIVIGRLVTDQALRRNFETDPLGTLEELAEQGTQLTPAEIAALVAIDPTLWNRAARLVDRRLLDADMRNG